MLYMSPRRKNGIKECLKKMMRQLVEQLGVDSVDGGGRVWRRRRIGRGDSRWPRLKRGGR